MTKEQRSAPSRTPVCRFYKSSAGCRRGIACPFRHGDENTSVAGTRSTEISELAVRFSNAELDENTVTISFAPSDPDFPFDLKYLHITLLVPDNYPAEQPVLAVINTDIPRGFALNIEHGFHEQIVAPGKSLLAMITELDERLEEFLKAEKRETIKIVNAGRKPAQSGATQAMPDALAEWGIDLDKLEVEDKQEQAHSDAELQAARALRERETRQLQTRLPGIKKLADDPATGDVVFSVPFEPADRTSVPACLKTVVSCRLVVPKLYNIDSCSIEFPDIDAPEARTIEHNFARHAAQNKGFSLFAHMNFLAQAVSSLARTDPEVSAVQEAYPDETEYTKPPEWDIVDSESDDDAYDNEDWYLSEDERRYYGPEETSSDETTANPQVAQPMPRGISINFPDLKLVNVAVLECTSLNLIVKCSRCKTEAEIAGIRPGQARQTTCAKCSTVLAVTSFVTEYMHETAVRMGYIGLEGCTPMDMLPSVFMPTCASCAKTLPGGAGITGLGIAQTISTNCRSCHAVMSILIPHVKFSRVADEPAEMAARTRKKRAAAKLGIIAGTPLPLEGTCKHYRRSTRWFRFSCCNRVFPCDRCHNEHSDHKDEHADKMICGMCSREQAYRPETCAFCRHSFFRKRTGFWEGGRGTRDKTKMSRKDPRKYKRLGKPTT